jgi:hypothetical protein
VEAAVGVAVGVAAHEEGDRGGQGFICSPLRSVRHENVTALDTGYDELRSIVATGSRLCLLVAPSSITLYLLVGFISKLAWRMSSAAKPVRVKVRTEVRK